MYDSVDGQPSTNLRWHAEVGTTWTFFQHALMHIPFSCAGKIRAYAAEWQMDGVRFEV